MHFAFNREQDAPKKSSGLDDALQYFREKGFQLSWHYWEVWKDEHTRAFTVAKITGQDLLMDIRQWVDKALAEGITFHTFKQQLIPLLAQKGWLGFTLSAQGQPIELGTPRRLKMIYDTNLRVARSAGQWARIQRSQKTLPYLLYSLGPSKEHRLMHERWSQFVLPVDDPFWQTHFPPNGWGCKCRVRALSAQEANKKGIAKTPAIRWVSWTHQPTGRTARIPEGIDPGWDYNPGQSRLDALKRYAQDKDKEFNQVFLPKKT